MIRALFADIDDTMTTDGVLPRESFEALWDARECGLPIIPVTGRPAGWCDMIARLWPVDGVIGENGAFYFRKSEGRIERVHCQAEGERRANHERMLALIPRILAEVPGCAVASDQAYREYDVAIDFCESVERLPMESVEKIVRIFKEAGAEAKVSSIHVNAWFGAFNKLTMVERYIRECFGMEFGEHREEFAFVGDSPNDEPMFEAFVRSYGVANVRPFLAQLRYKPAVIMEKCGGEGFAQVVNRIASDSAR